MAISGIADRQPFPAQQFADALAGNAGFVERFSGVGLSGRAARGLAIITCMDSRIDPLAVVGMEPGDVKILRNAGARVTDDVLRTLVLATHLLGVDRVLVMPHTDCRMASAEEEAIHASIQEQSGIDTRSVEIRTVRDQGSALVSDVQRIRSYPLLAPGTVVAGAVYDVQTGRLQTVDA